MCVYLVYCPDALGTTCETALILNPDACANPVLLLYCQKSCQNCPGTSVLLPSQENLVGKVPFTSKGGQTCLLNFGNKLTLNWHNFFVFYLI